MDQRETFSGKMSSDVSSPEMEVIWGQTIKKSSNVVVHFISLA